MSNEGEAGDGELLEGYFGTRQIRTDRSIKIPKLLREGDLLDQHETISPGDSLHWGIINESPVFAQEPRYLSTKWTDLEEISLSVATSVGDSETFPICGRFFSDYTQPGYAHLPQELHPDSVPQPAQLEQGQRIHFIRRWNQDLLDHDESGLSPGYVYQLLTWDELNNLDESEFKRLLPTYSQWSVLLDNITYDETMDNPGTPGEVLDRAMDAFDHIRSGPSD
jgi:hypothetical protein